MTTEKIIVLVSDKGDSSHGEISVLDDPRKAERLVETLLEAGFEEERIRVFCGRPSDFQISHRPVVALVAEGGEPELQPSLAAGGEAAAPAEPPPEKGPEGTAEEENGGAPEEEPATSESAPVRFSSLFRSA